MRLQVDNTEKKAAKLENEKAENRRLSVQKSKETPNKELKEQVQALDRRSPNNMYQRVPKKNLTRKEMQSKKHTMSFLHPDLQKHERVSLKKFNRKTFKRGMDESE